MPPPDPRSRTISPGLGCARAVGLPHPRWRSFPTKRNGDLSDMEVTNIFRYFPLASASEWGGCFLREAMGGSPIQFSGAEPLKRF